MKTQSTYLATACLILSFHNQSNAQYFNWVTGASGTNHGNSIAIDDSAHAYVVGSIETDTLQVDTVSFQGSVSNHTLNFATQYHGTIAYVTKYRIDDRQPLHTALITTGTVRPDGQCDTIDSVFGHQALVTNNGNVYVAGNFSGCDLVLTDTNGNPQLYTSSPTASAAELNMFLAIFDKNLTPIACHIINTASSHSNWVADIAKGVDHSDGQERVFLTGSVWGDSVNVETYGNATQPLSTAQNTATISSSDFEVYLAQFKTSNHQLDYSWVIGGPEHDHPAGLASGFLGQNQITDALYLVGSFQDEIWFNHPQNGPTIRISNGFYDIFACRIPGFDLQFQEPVVAGGQFNEQGLCISDDGRYVGGFICDSTEMVIAGTTILYNPSVGAITPFTGFNNGEKREFAFIAQPDYDNLEWAELDTVIEETMDTEMIALATGNCEDLYATYVMGMHPSDYYGLFSGGETNALPWYNFGQHATSVNFPSNGSVGPGHWFYSNISRWNTSGSQIDFLWEHQFWPSLTVGLSGVFNCASFIRDIQILPHNFTTEFIDYESPDYPNLLITGRFGDSIILDTAINSNPWFNGVVGTHGAGRSSMFFSALNDAPFFVLDTVEVCMTDTVQLTPVFDTTNISGIAQYLNDSSFFFAGAGIVDSFAPLFTPPSPGIHFVQGYFEFMGCMYKGDAFIIEVIEDTMPIHPISEGNAWAEGMAVEGVTQNKSSRHKYPYPLYFNSGTYNDSISFVHENEEDTITLYSSTQGGAGTSGYIVCYGPCGALWATNFQAAGAGGGYIENLVFDTANYNLYAVGSVDGPLDIINSHAGAVNPPGGAINNTTISFGSGFNFPQKGILAKLDPLNGGVDWVFVGGNDPNQSNEFHGLYLHKSNLLVVGEYDVAFDFGSGSNGVSLGSNGGSDVLYFAYDTAGFTVDAGGFGTANDDHGDAVTMNRLDAAGATGPNDFVFAIAGDLQSGAANTPIIHNFSSAQPSSTLTGGNGTEMFVATLAYYANTNAISGLGLRFFKGDGDDHAMDITKVDIHDNYNLNDELILVGQFSDSLEVIGVDSIGTFGVGDFDGFIMSLTGWLSGIWVSREGSAVNSNEAVEAVTMLDTIVYTTGSYEGTPVPGSFLSNSGLSAPGFRTHLYTMQFDPSGTLATSNVSEATAGNIGANRSSDICALDTSLLTTGIMAVPQNFDLIFNSNIEANTNFNEVYIARANASDNAYFKHRFVPYDNEPLSPTAVLYPNPNNGTFELEFDRKVSGLLTIHNSLGQLEYEDEIYEQERSSISGKYSSGLYFLTFRMEKQRISMRFVVNQ